MRGSFSFVIATVSLLVAVSVTCEAESIPSTGNTTVTEHPTAGRTGLLTDRLNNKQLSVWRAIEQIVFAEDRAGRRLYPSLYEAYMWAQTSGFSIYIEMPKSTSISPYEAAECVLETSSGTTPTLAIRIYVEVIDKACVERSRTAADRFVPFLGLAGESRYCETLAHELNHARQWLTDPQYAQLLKDQETLNSQFLQIVHQRATDTATREKKLELQHRLSELGDRIEAPAIAAEKQVWQELTSTRVIQLAANER